MIKDNEIFHLEFNRWLAEIKVIDFNKGLFHVHFLNEVPDLMLKKTMNANGDITWHSVTNEMQEIAAGLGESIDRFFGTTSI